MVTIRDTVETEFRERGARVVKARLTGIADGANTAVRGLRLLQNALFVLGAAGVVRRLVEMGDVLTATENRLRLVTDSIRELNDVQQELFALSRRSRADFEISAQIYARTALSVKTLGFEQSRLLQFTESLNQAVVLSGATAREANAALIQLAQGLASNRLSGDELRSVLEQLPFVADIIAESIGKTRGELRAFAKEGGITAKVVLDAFQGAREEIAEKFANTIPTASQAFNVLRTSIFQAIKTVNDATGATARLAQGILFLSENIYYLVGALTALTVAGGAFVASKLLGGITRATAGFFGYANAVARGRAALTTYGVEQNKHLIRSDLVARRAVSANKNELNRVNATIASTTSLKRLNTERLNAIKINNETRRARIASTGQFVSYSKAVDLANREEARKIRLDSRLARASTAQVAAIGGLTAAELALTTVRARNARFIVQSTSRFGRFARIFPRIATAIAVVLSKLRPLLSLLRPVTATFAGLSAIVGPAAAAFIATATGISAALYLLADRITVAGTGFTTLGDDIRAANEVIGDYTSAIREATGEFGAFVSYYVSTGANAVINYWNDLIDRVQEYNRVSRARDGQGIIGKLLTPAFLENFFGRIGRTADANAEFREAQNRFYGAPASGERTPEVDTSFQDYLASLEEELFFKRQTVNEQRILNTLKAAEKELDRELTERVGEGGNPGAFTEEDIIRQRVSKEIFDERSKAFDEYLVKLRRENDLLGLSNRERRLATAEQKAIAEFTGGDPNIETPSSRISSARQLEINKINIEAREAILGKIDALNKETDAIGLSARGLAAYTAVKQIADSIDRQLLPRDIDPVVAASNTRFDAAEEESRKVAFNEYLSRLKEEQTVLGETNRQSRIRLALKEHEVELFSDRGYQIVSAENALAEEKINKSIRDRIALLNAEGRNLKLSALNRAINVALAEEQLKAGRSLTELEGQAVATAVIDNFNDAERNKRLKSFQDYISAVDEEYRLLGLSNSEKRIEQELAEAKIANNGKELEFWQEASVVIREVLKQQKETNIAVEQQLENTQQSIDLLGLSNFQREIQIKLLRDEKAAIDGLTESQLNNLRQSYQQEQNITGQIAANNRISSLRERNQLALGTHPEIQSLRDNDIISSSDSPEVASAIATEIIKTQTASQLVLTQEQELAIAVEVRLAEAIKNTSNARESSKKTFADYVRELKRENAELLVNSRERAVLNSIHKIENALRITLTQPQRDIVRALREENAILKVYRGLLDDIQEPQLAYADNVAAITRLHEEGIISSLAFTESLRAQRIELLENRKQFGDGFELGYRRLFTSIADDNESIAGTITSAYSSSLNGIIQLALDGKGQFDTFGDAVRNTFANVVKDISAELLKLTLNKVFQSLFLNVAGGFGAGAAGGFNLTGFGQTLIGGNVASSIGAGAATTGTSGLASTLFPGLQNGGSFTVGQESGYPLPGIDNRLVPLRLQKGEEVNITPRGGKGGNSDGGDTYIFNISSPTPEAFASPQSQGQIARAAAGAITKAQRNS